MNVNNWINENSYGLSVGASGMDGCPDEVKFVKGCSVVRVTDTIKLLNTHAVVPREPNHKILDSMENIVRDEYKDHDWAKQQYQLAIKAAENG